MNAQRKAQNEWMHIMLAVWLGLATCSLSPGAATSDELGGAIGRYAAQDAAPDSLTTTDGTKVLTVQSGSAIANRVFDQGKVRLTSKNGATAVFSGRSTGWGCTFTVNGIYGNAFTSAVVRRGKAATWENEFEDANNPRIVLEVNGDGTDDDYVLYGTPESTITVTLLHGIPGVIYTVVPIRTEGPGEVGLPGVPDLSTVNAAWTGPVAGGTPGTAVIDSTVTTIGQGEPPATVSIQVLVTGREWDRLPAITNPTKAPMNTNDIKVSPGELVLFSIEGVDMDRWRVGQQPNWHGAMGTGPYEIVFTCTADAEFDAAGSGTRTKTVADIAAWNVSLFPKAQWDGANAITVTAVISDTSSAQVASPDTGTKRDEPLTITWTLQKRGTAPTTIVTTSGNNSQWNASPAWYDYKVGPDIGNDGQADYVNQAILETFGSPTPNGFFAMDDLTEAWREAHPSITTPPLAALVLFTSGVNGTFVIDNADTIRDQHSGFAEQESIAAFTAATQAAGIGYRITQEYKAGQNLLGSYTIDRKYTNGTVTVNKNGP